MGPIRSVARCYLRYFGFRGRASRGEYNWFLVFIGIVIGAAFLYLDYADAQARLNRPDVNTLSTEEHIAYLAAWANSDWPRPGVLFVVLGLIFVPGYAVAVRRGHDAGLDGMTAVFMFINPIGILRLIWMKGEPDENEHGPVPP